MNSKNEEKWAQVDRYLIERMGLMEPALAELLEHNSKSGLPPIDVSLNQGLFLKMMVQSLGAKRVLEFGTLGGFSAACMAMGQKEGEVVTLEISAENAEIAKANWQRMGLSSRIRLILGEAEKSLIHLANENGKPFDFVFIDADKKNNLNYLKASLPLTNEGSMIVIDNIVREGAILKSEAENPNVIWSQKLFDFIRSNRQLTATYLQTVGSKGWDGFLILRTTGSH